MGSKFELINRQSDMRIKLKSMMRQSKRAVSRECRIETDRLGDSAEIRDARDSLQTYPFDPSSLLLSQGSTAPTNRMRPTGVKGIIYGDELT